MNPINMHFVGLQTFESTESNTKELQEPEAKPEVQEEQTGKSKPLTISVFLVLLYKGDKRNRTGLLCQSWKMEL